MKVCGVELKSSDAIVCIMSRENGLYDIPHIRVQKVSLADAGDQEQVKHFRFTFEKLMADYKVDKVVIKGRAMKGKFAGGPVGFKLEGLIQSLDNVDVEIVAPSEIKKTLARSQINIDFRDTGLKNFQEQAFNTVFAYMESH